MKKIIWFVVAGLLVSTASIAQEDRKIEQAIKHRKAAFTLMSTYWSRILQTVDGDRPYDANAVIADAKKVEYLSRLPWEGFVAGSERGDTGLQSRHQARFHHALRVFQHDRVRHRAAGRRHHPGARPGGGGVAHAG